MLADVAVELPLVDLCALPPEQARAEALAQAQALARQGFDLTHAPLLRVALYRVAESTHLLVLVIHHIVSDGWSMGVLGRELAASTPATVKPLPALPVQYPDYALWQRAAAAGRDAGTATRLLAGPTGRAAAAGTAHRPSAAARPELSRRPPQLRPAGRLSAALKQLSRREGVTLYMLLLAAFQVLLARYSGQEDIAVGSPIAGRSRRRSSRA